MRKEWLTSVIKRSINGPLPIANVFVESTERAIKMRFRHRLRTLLVVLAVAVTNVTPLRCEVQDTNRIPRTLEILDVGYPLPIEILAARNLQNKEHWLRDFELEIRNSSSKSIYGLSLDLSMLDDVGPSGSPVAVSFGYGRSELTHPEQRPSMDDKPIEPGAKVSLRVDEKWWRGYESHLANDRVPEESTRRMRLTVVAISFGDGTGFINGGVPYPNSSSKSRPHRFVRIPMSSG